MDAEWPPYSPVRWTLLRARVFDFENESRVVESQASLFSHESKNGEWYNGILTCNHCGGTYRIRKGVLDTNSQFDIDLEQEYGAFLQHFNSKPVSKLSEGERDRFILALPGSTDDPSIAISFQETIQHMEPISGQ